jgi:DNA ligase (NAD+)
VFFNSSLEMNWKAIEDNGGKIGSSISAKTSYVAGITWDPKLEKAAKLNIPMLTETDFMKLVNEN